MLKGNPLSYRDTRKEDESSYVTLDALDNGPFGTYITAWKISIQESGDF